VLVYEINALGVKDITDLNINRNILQSLRKPDYDLVKAIIYEKKLEELKPSHILSKIMAHELQIMPKSKKAPQEKPQEPSSPTTSHALSSQQEKVLSRMATHGSSSEDDGDDGDDEDSSSDEVESMVAEYVKKIFKYVKKVNMYGYNVHLREGCHHQHIKFTKIEHKPKKKVVKERRPRQEATIAVREWTSGGESSSSSSSDESRKNFTTHFKSLILVIHDNMIIETNLIVQHAFVDTSRSQGCKNITCQNDKIKGQNRARKEKKSHRRMNRRYPNSKRRCNRRTSWFTR
jgi:hypothetical protein